ncbi:urea ABC transporter permease subunit UrtB [Desulfogranum japonicum]|uniref:urea ABC transporter permease subunit UrtB n=1 Tax=Desulfogranum japonicum TaxID=231447 RepID=UPI0004109436|nr:urea ABC transporter permease subunit UrtB [Desulfogranum japonicum]
MGQHHYRALLSLVTLPFLLLVCFFPAVAAQTATQESFEQGIHLLKSRKFQEKNRAVELITDSGDPRSMDVLQDLLAGKLFLLRTDQTVVQVKSAKGGYAVTGVLQQQDLGTLQTRQLKKITINNALRGALKSGIAKINLQHPDPGVRANAVESMLEEITADSVQMLEELKTKEQNKAVRRELETAIAISWLKGNDEAQKLKALDTLSGSLTPVVRNELKKITTQENSEAVQKKALQALHTIEAKVKWYAKLETLFFGLSLGSVLVLAAIGLAITFGVIGVINMAHGELIMIGAYTTYVLQQCMPDHIGLSLALAIPAAFCVSGLVGVIIERSVIRFLYGRPLETLLATFGISLILQQTVRSIFSPLNRSVITPEWMTGSLAINPVLSLTTNRVTVFIFAMLVFTTLYILLKKSSLGLQVRAVSQNRAMARSMGIHAAKVDALTFGLGSGIAGIAGVALSQLTNVGPNLGQSYIIDSFMVVVFGGVGNLWGTMLGGLSLGIANKVLEPWSGAVLAKILILVLIILFIQKRPQGLFPQKGRAAE